MCCYWNDCPLAHGWVIAIEHLPPNLRFGDVLMLILIMVLVTISMCLERVGRCSAMRTKQDG